MVLKGQFLERPTLIPSARGIVLEGVSHRGHRTPGVLVLPPPPSEGGGMDTVVGAEIAYAVSRAGFPTLRFNYRGVGASQGKRSSDPDVLLTDALAALELATDNAQGQPPVVVSLGGSDAVALQLRARKAKVAALLLIHPSLARPSELATVDVPLDVILPEFDEQPRAAWAKALSERDGVLTVVAGADRSYQRNLPLVGRAVCELALRVATT